MLSVVIIYRRNLFTCVQVSRFVPSFGEGWPNKLEVLFRALIAKIPTVFKWQIQI